VSIIILCLDETSIVSGLDFHFGLKIIMVAAGVVDGGRKEEEAKRGRSSCAIPHQTSSCLPLASNINY